MTDLWGNAIGVMIVLMMVTFLGIWVWAWRGRHKPVFQQMAAMPMEDTPQPFDENFPQKNHSQANEEQTP